MVLWNEVVSGMMKSKRSLSATCRQEQQMILQAVCIFQNLIAAANTIVKGQTYSCDIGSFNDYYFTYVAAFAYLLMFPMKQNRKQRIY